MSLNDLDLEELKELASTMVALEYIGSELAERDLTPRFNLSPGQPVTISIDFTMPTTPGQATLADVARIEAKLDQRLLEDVHLLARAERLADGPVHVRPDQDLTADMVRNLCAAGHTPFFEAAPPIPAPEPEETPPAAGNHAGGTLSYDQEDEIDERAFHSADPSRSDDAAAPPPAAPEASPPPLAEAASSEGAAEDSGGGQHLAAAEPPAAPVGSHERTFGGAAIWTEEEDECVVDLVASGVCGLGLSKAAAIRAAAAELGRPLPGTTFRCHHKLKDRIGLAILSRTSSAPEPTPSPEAAPSSADGDAAVGGHSPAAVQDAPVADALTGHLMSLPDKGGWTLARDLELMELSIAGWQPNEIALQLQVQANQIKPRFDALTGLYEDATGKKLRRFTREAVFEALTTLAQKVA